MSGIRYLSIMGIAIIALTSSYAAEEVKDAPSATAFTPINVVESMAQAVEMQATAKSELDSIPEQMETNAREAQRRTVLERRIALLSEYMKQQSDAEARAAQQARLEDRQRQAQEQQKQLAEAPESQPPREPTREGFGELTEKVSQQRTGLEAMRAGLNESRQRMENLPKLVADAQARAGEAQERAARFTKEAMAASDSAEKSLLELRAANANLEQQIALGNVTNLQEAVKLDKVLEPIITIELDLAESHLQKMEADLSHYSAAIEQQLVGERGQMAQELVRKQELADSALTPAESFIAKYEAGLAQSTVDKSDLEAFLVRIQKDQAELEKRLSSEKIELDSLKEYFQLPGLVTQASDKMRRVRELLALRRAALIRSLRSGVVESVDEYRSRRFELEDTLFNLNDMWESELTEALNNVSKNDKAVFKTRADKLLPEYRTALREERALLTDAITLGQQVQNLTLARIENANTTERFIRSKAFTLRDTKPLTWRIANLVMEEYHSVSVWARDLASSGGRASFHQFIHDTLTIVLGVLLFPVLPLLLFYIRYQVRRRVRRVYNGLDDHEGVCYRALMIVYSIFAAALLPSYLLLTAWMFNSLAIPGSIRPILSSMCEYGSYFLFLWLVARAMFSGQGVAHIHFGMPLKAGYELYRAIRLIAVACGVLLTITWILEQEPFNLNAIPRLGYILFEFIAGFAIARLLWSRNAFCEFILDWCDSPLIQRYWPLLKGCILLLIASIITLDVLGYRYASQSLAISFGLSALVFLALPPLYMLLTCAANSFFDKHIRPQFILDMETGDETVSPVWDSHQVRRFFHMLFLIAGVVIVARIWGLDSQAIKNLDEIHIYSIFGAEDAEEFVSAGDICQAFLYIMATIWILRRLPGIYEFAIFPRSRLDVGAKYAVLTISRYGIFAIGFFFALSAIHLDLVRLSWLIAAVGVGLGFGLQEIVSNFVSGIILLIERPIQVDDIVTVGGMSGTVRRINIRATTILNFDHQEVVVPNRELVTKEVINWTRGDTINRQVINIGVAHGSDVELVTTILQSIAKNDPEVLDDPPPIVTFARHGDSSLDFVLRVFMPTPDVIFSVCDRINKSINHEFARHGIKIPFPQQDIHIRDCDAIAGN